MASTYALPPCPTLTTRVDPPPAGGVGVGVGAVPLAKPEVSALRHAGFDVTGLVYVLIVPRTVSRTVSVYCRLVNPPQNTQKSWPGIGRASSIFTNTSGTSGAPGACGTSSGNVKNPNTSFCGIACACSVGGFPAGFGLTATSDSSNA